MIDSQLQRAAEEFIRHVKSSQLVQEYLTAQKNFQKHPDVKKLREAFASLSQEFYQKQVNGTLTQEDIATLRMAQQQLNVHPITMQFASSRQALLMIVRTATAL